MRPSRFAILSICLASACGDGGAPEDLPVDGNPGGQTYTIEWGPVEVQPLEEDTRCVTLELANDIPIRVDSIHNTLGATSHHFIVYRVNGDPINETPTPCTPFVDTLDPTKGAPLMITQRPEETIQLPEGVAFTLQAHQRVRLEMHFINPSNSTVTATATSELHVMPDAEFRDEADFLFIGNPDISLPSSSQVQSLGPTWFPYPSGLDGVNVFALTGHTHQLGVDVNIAVAPTEADPGSMVYQPDNFNWAEPDTVRLDPPLVLPAGGGFRFTCSWINETGGNVGFGESANDEMCFFWAYYYPSKGSKVCVHSEMYTADPLDICCPDDAVFCSLINDYLEDGLPQ
jgi:hypothetical protein